MVNRTTAIALFDDRIQAQRAIAQLKSAGFTEKEIGLTSRDEETDHGVGDGSKEAHVKKGAIAGVATGAGVGALIGLGIPEEEASYYEREFKAGRTLVTVNAGSRVPEAQAILVEKGGYDMRSAPARAPTEDEALVDANVPRGTIKVDKRGRATPPPQR